MNEEQIKKHYEKKAQKQIARDNAKTDYKQKVLENRKKLIPNMLEIKQLKAQLKEPTIRRRISNILLLLAIIMTCVTTLTTIAGGLNYRNTILTMVTYILFVVFAQITILVISCLKPYLYNKAPRYISITSMLQVFLLIVSISFNFIFLHNSDNSGYIVFLNLILCVIFDLVILVICELSFVIRLNIVFVKRNSMVKGLLGKIIFNFTYKFINSIEQTYKNNKNGLTFVQDKETVKKLDYKQDRKESISNIDMDKDSVDKLSYKQDSKESNITEFVQDKDRELIKNAILNNKDENICPSISTLMDLTGFSKNKVIAIKKLLELEGIIETVGKKTLIK
jgi:hypothetical protein